MSKTAVNVVASDNHEQHFHKKKKKKDRKRKKEKKKRRKEQQEHEEHLDTTERKKHKKMTDAADDEKKKRRKENQQEHEEHDETTERKKRKKMTDAADDEKKKRRKENQEHEEHDNTKSKKHKEMSDAAELPKKQVQNDHKIVETSALDFATTESTKQEHDVTLLLFYQYVEPPWDASKYAQVLKHVQELGDSLKLTGRMRVAKEGLNCTLTGTHQSILHFCQALREYKEFCDTEFKLTRDLPHAQCFSQLKVIPVTELVHYGLEDQKAPPMEFTGTHLQPLEYHEKLADPDTVVIDVRNHYEAAIGHFNAPNSTWLDPKMRKSTEFPAWLDQDATKQKLKGKQVLMYCTGGVRCERASALLKYKMETDDSVKDLNIKGVYQLQGGIDKYFKEFPEGGYWEGKNYTFDKRFAHAPPAKSEAEVMGSCHGCGKPWDMYRGKRRCPTCGVPSLICRDCFQANRRVQCSLCVEEKITSKAQLKDREEAMSRRVNVAPNPNRVTRLYVKNMCRKHMDQATLMDTLSGITHIVWRNDRKSGEFLGSAWVEMATPEDAAFAVGLNGMRVLNRPLYITFQPPDGKDAWPPPSSKVKY